jgi:tetratricopeptide (TPR) repeat protein
MSSSLTTGRNKMMLNLCWDKFVDNGIAAFIRNDVKVPSTDLRASAQAEFVRPRPNLMAPREASFDRILGEDLLIYHDRPVRPPLPEWASYIHDQLDRYVAHDEASGPSHEQVSKHYNQAALIELNYGRIESALGLCSAHLEWLAFVINRTGRLELAELGLQPWINLGRLDRFTGKPDESLKKFAYLLSGKNRAELNIGPIRITPKCWEAIISRNANVHSFIENVYVLELLKTYLRHMRYEAILSFRERAEVDNFDRMEDFWKEAKVVALCRLGRKQEALEFAEACASAGAFWNWPIFNLHRATILGVCGKFGDARTLMAELAHVVEGFRIDEKPNLSKLFFALKVVAMLDELNETEAAYKIAQAGYAGATKINDEPLRFDFMTQLINLSNQGYERESLMDFLREMTEATCYNWLRWKVSNIVADYGVEMAPFRATSVTVETLTNRLLALDRHTSSAH